MIIIRFLIESCIEVGLVALVAVVMINKERFDYFQDGFTMVLAMVTLGGLGFAPIYLIYVGHRLLKKPHLLTVK